MFPHNFGLTSLDQEGTFLYELGTEFLLLQSNQDLNLVVKSALCKLRQNVSKYFEDCIWSSGQLRWEQEMAILESLLFNKSIVKLIIVVFYLLFLEHMSLYN